MSVAANSDIWTAAGAGDLGAIKRVVEAGADTNAGDPLLGVTPLSWASLHGHTDAVDLLLNRDADVNVRNPDGATALHLAAFLGRAKTVDLLLNRDADVNARNHSGDTPMDLLSVDWGATQFIAGLLRIEIDEKEVETGRARVAELLGQRPAERGQTPDIDIWTAARRGDVNAIVRAVEAWADIDKGGAEFGVTPLCWAALLGHTEAVEALLEQGADVNTRNRDGATALHGAAFFGRVKTVDLLLKRDADVNARNHSGDTPMDGLAWDWGTTQFIAGLLRIEIDEKEVEAGRAKAAEILAQREAMN